MNNFSSTKLTRRFLTPLFFLFALLLMLPSLANAQTGIAAADREMQMWRFFAPEGGNFKVSLPVQPEGAIVPVETQDSTLDAHIFAAKTTASIYSIIYIDFPVYLKDSAAIEAGFDAGRDRILKTFQSAVKVSEKKLVLNSIPGREFVYENGANVFKLRMYLVKQRLYTLQLTTPQTNNLPIALAKVYQAESDKFFNSFQIMDNAKVETPTKGKKK